MTAVNRVMQGKEEGKVACDEGRDNGLELVNEKVSSVSKSDQLEPQINFSSTCFVRLFLASFSTLVSLIIVNEFFVSCRLYHHRSFSHSFGEDFRFPC